MQPFRYFEADPPPALAGHLLVHWGFDVRAGTRRGARHTIPPDGCVSVACRFRRGHLDLLTVVGPRVRAARVPVRAGDAFRGVRFWPDSGGALLGRPAEGLRDAWLPAEAALGRDGARLRAALAAGGPSGVSAAFEAWAAPLAARVPARDAAVREAVCAIVARCGELSIAALAREVGLSGRQLLRRFRAATGLTPKEFARVRRLRSVTAGLLAGETGGWSATAARFGFADQAHLIHEFARMTGSTPTAFRARLAAIEHVRVRP